MRVGTAIAPITIVLTLPFAAGAQPSMLRGLGVDERLDEPSAFERARAAGASGSRSLFVQLFVPRSLVETQPGVYAFDLLDQRMSVLEGATILLALGGMPRTAEAGESWRSYVLAVAERYSSKVRGFVLGSTDSNTPWAPRPQVETYAYLIKLAAIQVRSIRSDALLIEGDGRPREPDWVESLYREDVAPYFDGMAVATDLALSRDHFDERLGELRKTLERYDPSTQIIVTGVALGGDSGEAIRRLLIDSFSNLAAGSALTTFSGNEEAIQGVLAVASRLSGILVSRVVALDDRGQAGLNIEADGRPAHGVHHRLLFNADTGSTLLVYWGESPAVSERVLDIALRSFVPGAPTLSDPGGAGALPIEAFDYDADAGLARTRVPILDRPLILEYAAPVSGATVTASAGLEVSEIIARHQQAEARQENLLVSYHASVRDEIHFRPSPIDSFDVIIESRFYSDREGSEWEELSFSLNGARWGADRPPFPLLQPEKVLSLPLDLRLDQDYEYQLTGREKLVDRDCYVVRFEPIEEGRSLYDGRVWIDSQSFVKLKVEAVQKQLSAPIVSNAEVYSYEPHAVVDGAPLYLLTHLSSKQLVLIAGRNLLVEKESQFYDFQVNSPDFENARDAARVSDHIMLRDTEDGLRYFVERGGKREVSDELTRSAKALAMGTTVDPSFDFPLPIFGLNYLDFDFLDSNAQFALLFGGIFALGNIQKSDLLGGSFDASLDFFGIGIQSNDVVFDQDGKIDEESLTTLPASFGINLGWQATDFQKVTARYDLRYDHYGRVETTPEDFITPTSTFTNGFTLGYELRKRGYSLLGSGSYARRADWEPWGDVSSFDPETQSYWKYRFVLGKDFFFKTFHKLHVDAGYFGGERLDRFTKYQFGLFDETRVRGVPSTAVRFAELVLARASYSFNVFDQFRFELFYDRGWGDDPGQGLERVGFSGLGVGLNLRGPRHTIIRVDVGKGFLPEALQGAGTVVMQFLILKPL